MSINTEFHIYDSEKFALVKHLLSPIGQQAKTTVDRDDRRRLNTTLEQIGALRMFELLTSPEGLPKSELTTIPRLIKPDVSTIDYLLKILSGPMLTELSVSLLPLEERLEKVKSENYKIPDKIAAQIRSF